MASDTPVTSAPPTRSPVASPSTPQAAASPRKALNAETPPSAAPQAVSAATTAAAKPVEFGQKPPSTLQLPRDLRLFHSQIYKNAIVYDHPTTGKRLDDNGAVLQGRIKEQIKARDPQLSDEAVNNTTKALILSNLKKEMLLASRVHAPAEALADVPFDFTEAGLSPKADELANFFALARYNHVYYRNHNLGDILEKWAPDLRAGGGIIRPDEGKLINTYEPQSMGLMIRLVDRLEKAGKTNELNALMDEIMKYGQFTGRKNQVAKVQEMWNYVRSGEMAKDIYNAESGNYASVGHGVAPMESKPWDEDILAGRFAHPLGGHGGGGGSSSGGGSGASGGNPPVAASSSPSYSSGGSRGSSATSGSVPVQSSYASSGAHYASTAPYAASTGATTPYNAPLSWQTLGQNPAALPDGMLGVNHPLSLQTLGYILQLLFALLQWASQSNGAQPFTNAMQPGSLASVAPAGMHFPDPAGNPQIAMLAGNRQT